MRDLDVTFETDAGPRRVELHGDVATVEMGTSTVTRLGDPHADVDVGNPHLVLLVDDPAAVDLEALGAQHPDLNVELIAPVAPDELGFRVHERGAGITMACGTGSCAAAAAAHSWGLVGPSVVVHNPGGDVTVELKDDEALLTGETVWIADVERRMALIEREVPERIILVGVTIPPERTDETEVHLDELAPGRHGRCRRRRPRAATS